MSEMVEYWKDIKQERQREGRNRRKAAEEAYRAAATLLNEQGIQLICCDETHYKVRTDKWLYNIYPGNQRIYADPNYKGPFLNLPDDWTLLDVAKEILKHANS